MNKLKIVYCLRDFSMVGGIETVTSAKMNYLATVDGVEVSVVYTSLGARNNIYKLNPNIKEYFLDFNEGEPYRHRFPVRLWYKRKQRQEICMAVQRVVDKIQPDVIICNHHTFCDVKPLVTKAKLLYESHSASNKLYLETGSRIPVFKLQYAWLKVWLRHWGIRRRVDCVVCLTHGDADDTWKGARRTEVIPNIVDYRPEVPYAADSKSVIIGGRLVRQKKMDDSILAWSIVHKKHPDWQLHIYGEGEYDGFLRSLIHEKGLDDVVFIHPFTSELYKRMQESAVYLMSSMYEGFSLVIIEAMMNGLPVVSYNCPYGPADLITDNGILVEHLNVGKLAEALCWMIEHPEERRRMGALGHKYAQQYLAESIMGKWLSLFTDLKKNIK